MYFTHSHGPRNIDPTPPPCWPAVPRPLRSWPFAPQRPSTREWQFIPHGSTPSSQAPRGNQHEENPSHKPIARHIVTRWIACVWPVPQNSVLVSILTFCLLLNQTAILLYFFYHVFPLPTHASFPLRRGSLRCLSPTGKGPPPSPPPSIQRFASEATQQPRALVFGRGSEGRWDLITTLLFRSQLRLRFAVRCGLYTKCRQWTLTEQQNKGPSQHRGSFVVGRSAQGRRSTEAFIWEKRAVEGSSPCNWERREYPEVEYLRQFSCNQKSFSSLWSPFPFRYFFLTNRIEVVYLFWTKWLILTVQPGLRSSDPPPIPIGPVYAPIAPLTAAPQIPVPTRVAGWPSKRCERRQNTSFQRRSFFGGVNA